MEEEDSSREYDSTIEGNDTSFNFCSVEWHFSVESYIVVLLVLLVVLNGLEIGDWGSSSPPQTIIMMCTTITTSY